MKELVDAILEQTATDGLHSTGVSGVSCLRFSSPSRPRRHLWKPSLALLAQGSKELVLNGRTLSYSAGHYLAAPIELPVNSRVKEASGSRPFLSILVSLDPTTLLEVRHSTPATLSRRKTSVALFSDAVEEDLAECALRLVRLAQRPEDAQVLGPLVVKEMLYYLLRGRHGESIFRFALSGDVNHRIARAIFEIRTRFSESISVDELAQSVAMSRSAFFKHFKELTSLSPLQYQKRLRLLEAGRLLEEEDETAKSAAFRVGYGSVSQFSREYSRMFGHPPIRAKQLLRSCATSPCE